MKEKESVIKTLLGSLRFSPPGGKWQFLWNPDNSYSFVGGFVFEFYIDFEQQIIASLKAIKCYPEYLNGCAVSTVTSLLHKYFESIITEIESDELFFPQGHIGSVADCTHFSKIPILIDRLDRFIVDNAKPSVYLMPVNGFPCPLALVTTSLSWVQGTFNLAEILTRFGVHKSLIKNSCFPPIIDFNVKSYELTDNDSWFICSASSGFEAESIFKRMVGGLSVILGYPESRSITGREMIGGRGKFSYDKCAVTS